MNTATTAENTLVSKPEYEKSAEARVSKWTTDFESLRARLAKSENPNFGLLSDGFKALEHHRNVLAARLAEIKAFNGGEWEVLRDGLENSLSLADKSISFAVQSMRPVPRYASTSPAGADGRPLKALAQP